MIDCDVHCAPDSLDALLPHFDEYWRDYLTGGGLRLDPQLGGAYPPGARTTGVPGPLPLDGVDLAVLNCLAAFDSNRNLYYEAALARAVNDWLRAEWLDRDERLRAGIVVPSLDPDAAGEEIERLASDTRLVQVLLPVRSDVPYGNKRHHGIYEAAARHGLVVGIHAWGRPGGAPTASGFTHTYLEDYVLNGQVVAQAQLVSLISEGVFDRFPALRVAFLECGFSWLHPLLWRFDKDWKGIWREVPWVKAKPTEYVRRHVRFTLEPAHLPADAAQAAEVAEMLGAADLLLYASDHPHDHGDGGRRLLDALDEAGREAVLHGNAAELYRRGAA